MSLIQSGQDEILGRSHSAKRIADEHAVLTGHEFRNVSLTHKAKLFATLDDVHSAEEEKRQVRSWDKKVRRDECGEGGRVAIYDASISFVELGWLMRFRAPHCSIMALGWDRREEAALKARPQCVRIFTSLHSFSFSSDRELSHCVASFYFRSYERSWHCIARLGP